MKVVRGAGLVVVALLASLAWGTSARALPLQELSAHASGRVAHLSIRDKHGEEESSGTGFVISKDGRMATNYHVIDGAQRIVAVFPDQRNVEVTGVWVSDKEVDLAILQLAGGPFEPLELANDRAVPGEDIVLIGSPLGLSNSISAGIVSAVRDKGIEGSDRMDAATNWSLQITAAASPGSSGSPILRGNGEVVGVMVGSLGGLDGMHFGIAVEKLRRMAAAAPKRPAPLASARDERSVTQNLLISGAFFSALGLIWFVWSKWPARRMSVKH